MLIVPSMVVLGFAANDRGGIDPRRGGQRVRAAIYGRRTAIRL